MCSARKGRVYAVVNRLIMYDLLCILLLFISLFNLDKNDCTVHYFNDIISFIFLFTCLNLHFVFHLRILRLCYLPAYTSILVYYCLYLHFITYLLLLTLCYFSHFYNFVYLVASDFTLLFTCFYLHILFICFFPLCHLPAFILNFH